MEKSDLGTISDYILNQPVEKKKGGSKMYKEKLYVIVRKDLAPIYKMVQGTHAVCKFQNRYPESFRAWNNNSLIFVEVSNPLELEKIYNRFCVQFDIAVEVFYKPDLYHHMTAMAFMLNEDIPYDVYAEILDLPLASL